MWSHAKTRSARKKRSGFEWATRSTSIDAAPVPGITATLPSGIAVAPPRAFGADAETLSPDDVVEYVSDEAFKPTVPVEPLMMAPPRVTPSALAQVIDHVPEDPAPRSSLLSFLSDHWAFAAAFVLVGGLALRLTFPAGPPPATPAPITSVSKATCVDTNVPLPAPLLTDPPSSSSPLPPSSSSSDAPVVASPPRPPRARTSVKRPPAVPATAPQPTPAATDKASPSSSAKRTLDAALAELVAN